MSRVLIVGPGALGITAAVRLHSAGHAVLVAARTKEKARRLTKSGLTLRSFDGTTATAHVPVISSPKDLDAPVDLVVLATKLHVAADVVTKWLPALADDGVVVPFYNGMVGDELAALVGDRYLEGSVFFPATLLEDGIAEETGMGAIRVGPWPRGGAGAHSKAAWAASVLGAVQPSTASNDMFSVKWSKICINSAATSLGLVSGKDMAGMMQDKAVRGAFIATLREGMEIASAADAKIVAVGGVKLPLLRRIPGPVADAVLRLLARRYRRYRSSGQQSLQRGQKTEIGWINGRVCQEGRVLGLDTPWNDALVAAVADVEAGRAEPGPELVARVVAEGTGGP